MLALVEYRSRGENKERGRRLCGVFFHVAKVRDGSMLAARLSALRAARVLSGLGVRTAVFPPDYPFGRIFARYGIVPPDTEALNRAAALPAIRLALAQLGVEPRRAHVALAAPCVTSELGMLALSLCDEVGRISLRAGSGEERLARELMRAKGVALGCGTDRADLTAAYGDAEAKGAVLRLDAKRRIEFESEYPDELLAALLNAGALKASALKVRRVVLCDDHGSAG